MARYKESSYLPFISLFEITFLYAWMMGLLYIILMRIGLAKFIQGIFLFIIYGILIWDFFLDKSIGALNPALKSFWLAIHVPSAILGYGAFALSFAVSLYYILVYKKNRPLSHLEIFNSRLIISGTILLGICIITGGIWAKSAWGKFWSWDPKEIWALITFMVYTAAIVIRKVFKVGSRWQAFISIAGFLAMLFTFFGINLFFASHHAY